MLKRSFFFALSLSIAAPALASEQRKETCEITADIVSQAVAARLDGRTQAQAKTDLSQDGSGITGIYKATIPSLVDMVYGFEQSTLGDGVVEDYRAQCLKL